MQHAYCRAAVAGTRIRDAVSGCIPANAKLWDARNFIFGGDHVYDCTLPGFDARYLTRFPGSVPGWDHQALHQIESAATYWRAFANLLS